MEDSNLNENNVLALPVHEPSHVLEPKPAAPAPRIDTPVPNTLPEPATKVSEEEQTKVQPAEQLEGQGLEDFEKQMFDSLKEKKSKGGGKGMKKPAAAAKTAKTAAAPKPKAVKKEPKGPKTSVKVYGCPRCRGNKKGCTTCWDPLYKGVKLPGREPWKQYMAKKGKAVK